MLSSLPSVSTEPQVSIAGTGLGRRPLSQTTHCPLPRLPLFPIHPLSWLSSSHGLLMFLTEKLRCSQLHCLLSIPGMPQGPCRCCFLSPKNVHARTHPTFAPLSPTQTSGLISDVNFTERQASLGEALCSSLSFPFLGFQSFINIQFNSLLHVMVGKDLNLLLSTK